MKKRLCLFLLLISGFYLSASGSLLTIYAGNDFYMSEDRIDTTNKKNDLYFDFGFGLDGIAGIGLSLHTDIKAANAFLDGVSGASMRKTFEMSAGYLDWRSDNGLFGARVGRQPYTNLCFDSYDFDGLAVSVQPNSKSLVNIAAGMLVPTPWGKPFDTLEVVSSRDDSLNGLYFTVDSIASVTRYHHYNFSNPAKAGFAMIDGSVSMIPFTTLTAGIALVPAPIMRPTFGYDTILYVENDSIKNDSVALVEHGADSTGDFRVALGADISPLSFLRFTGSGRFSLYHKGLDRFDARVRYLPGKIADISVYFLGEKGRIDSTNYFSYMFFDQLHEFGLTANFYSESGVTVQADYHGTSFVNEGIDHFVGFDASHRYLYAGGVLGFGYHGQTIRTSGGFSIPFLKFFVLEGFAEYFRSFPVAYRPAAYDPFAGPEVVQPLGLDDSLATPVPVELFRFNKSPHNALLFAAGLKMSFSPIGLTIRPRVEYIVNRYYQQDVRFLLTTNLLIKKYWSSGAGAGQ